MALQRSSRVGFSLLALLASVPVLLVSFAADARARHHHRVHATHFAPGNAITPVSSQNGAHGVQKSEEYHAPNPETALDKTNDDKQRGRRSVGAGQGGNEGEAGSAPPNTGTKETNLPDMKALGPVDTSITIVGPRLHGAKAEMTRQGASKINSKAKYFHARRAFIRRKNNPVVRNAIGVPMAPHGVTAGQHGVSAGAPADDRSGTQKGVVGASPGIGPTGVFHSNVEMGRSEPFANHGAISGTSFPHRGFVPAGLGGRTKMTGGLSGSMIRPKY